MGGASLNYTVVEVNRDGIETDVPWLSVDKYTGGPIAPSGTDIVTATVDYTKLEVGANTAWLRFAVDCDPCSRFDVKFVAPSILNYNGDMDPTTPNAAGPGLNWTAFNMAGTIDEAVEPYPDTLDNAVWKMTDGGGAKKQYKSNSMNIGSLQGATIVARVAVTVKIAPSGENIGIKHDAGASAGYHWGGAGYSSPYNAPGHVKETERGDQLWIEDQTPEFYAGWHILRLTVKGDNGDAGPRTIRLYLDEDPTPIIEIPNAVGASATDLFTFGTPSTDGHQVIYFDWITATDAGAFGPGEEDDCIGQSLCLGPGCYESPCNIDVFADADEDGDVDQADFAVFQLCYTGDGGGVLSDPEYCQCLDRRNNDNSSGQDNDIDSFDLAAFEDCASGPGVPADPACDD
ncbi:MAG: hypothetical protein GX616_26505 [Planctomycetes bacterium]|nr:hypothetical protein [Planctomycetota bacterium]